MEFLAVTLLAAPIDAGLATTTQVVSMLLIMRLYQVIYGLLGSGHPAPRRYPTCTHRKPTAGRMLPKPKSEKGRVKRGE